MKNNKVKVSIFSTIWGHHSIGKAVEDALSSKYHTYFNSIKPEVLLSKSYTALYLLFPSLNKIPYKISESNRVSKLGLKYLSKSYSKKIEALIKKQKPKIVVSAYFPFSYVLEKLEKKYHFKLINIVSDPRTFHKALISKNSYNLVFDKKSVKRCSQFNIPKHLCIQSGWFVREEFIRPISKEGTRILLDLSPNIFTVCVNGGSEGMINIIKILPAFLSLNKKVQVIFLCGKNRGLYSSLLSITKIFRPLLTNTKFIVKGYSENTYQYLHASDLIIGKAGPNLLFESVATHTPFLAISHIWGQEDGNLDIIREYKLGFVEERPSRAVKLTQNIINNPKILDRFSKPLEKLSAYNENSYNILLRFIEEKLLKEC